MSLAAPTIYVAVDTALLADSGYMTNAVDRGVYAAGDVPNNQRLTDNAQKNGYTVIESSLEGPDDLFATDGAAGTLTLGVRAISKKWALILARHIHRVLHGKPLPSGVMSPDSIGWVSGVVQLIEDYPNPDGGHSAILHYSTSTVMTA